MNETLYERLFKAMKPEDIDHHASDLYVRVTDESTRIVHEYANELNEELGVEFEFSTFYSNINPHELWYDLPFEYIPYWYRK